MRTGVLITAGVLALAFGIYCIALKQNRTAAGWICAGCAIVLVVAIIILLLFPKYSPVATSGQYDVQTAAFCYEDTERIETYKSDGSFRRVSAGFWYPDSDSILGKSAPLIIFSHGGLGVKESNESLYRELASHGYVVCSIDHTYQSLASKDADGKHTGINMDYMKETSQVDAKKDPVQALALYQKWMRIRTGDMNFIIDKIIEEANGAERAAELFRLIDVTRIGVMGHSLGGSAALGIGRSREDVAAVIALESPFLCDIERLDDKNCFVFNSMPYPIPLLNVYSDDSFEQLGVWPEYGQNAALLTDENTEIFNVHITGAGHFSLTDLSLSSPFLTQLFNASKTTVETEYCLKTINALCLSFFDCYLKGEGKFSPQQTY